MQLHAGYGNRADRKYAAKCIRKTPRDSATTNQYWERQLREPGVAQGNDEGQSAIKAFVGGLFPSGHNEQP